MTNVPIWTDYDQETDSLVVYLAGKPVRCVNVLVRDGVYLIIDPATKKFVGMQIEG